MAATRPKQHVQDSPNSPLDRGKATLHRLTCLVQIARVCAFAVQDLDWHLGQMYEEVVPVLIFSIVVPQFGHGLPGL